MDGLSRHVRIRAGLRIPWNSSVLCLNARSRYRESVRKWAYGKTGEARELSHVTVRHGLHENKVQDLKDVIRLATIGPPSASIDTIMANIPTHHTYMH